MKNYLFKTNIFYNNQELFYQIESLPDSIITVAYIFGGKDERFMSHGLIYIYLELSNDLTPENIYFNLQRLLNLISLETVTPANYQEIPITETDNFQSVLSQFQSNEFYKEGISFSGFAPIPNHIFRVQQLVKLINKLNKKDFKKFDNSLNTYIWALELKSLPNPHLKFTLYMTLLLSSIEQLADSPEYCTKHPICTECKKELFHHIIDKGQKHALDNLIRNLLTGDGVEEGIKRVNLLYSKLRSKFLHLGNRYGKEEHGGFLGKINNDKELLEHEINIVIMNQKLLEQFLVKNAS